MFKTMGYSPGFLLKNCQISTLSNSPEIDKNSRAKSQKSFQNSLGGISESLERFPGLFQIRHVQNHGLQPRLFVQKHSIFDPVGFFRNRHKQSRKELEIILEVFRVPLREFGAISRTCPNPPYSKPWAIAQGFCSKPAKFRPSRILPKSNKQSRKVLEIILEGFWRHFREFGAISRTCPNPPFSKPWAIAQAFCSKTFDFRPSRILQKSTQTVAQRVRNHFRIVQEAFQRVWSDFQDLPKSAMFKTMGYSPGFVLKNGQISTLSNSPEIDTNSRTKSWKSFQNSLGGISESLERFPGLAQIRHVQNHGLQPMLFAQNPSIFDPIEFSRNRHKQSRKELEIILEGFRRHFREFGAISRTCPNPPFSKPWAIAHAFCSQIFDFRPSRMFPKSTQTVAQRVRNHFRRVQEAFQRVWSDFQDLPKSAIFKTMGYSPGFLLKTCQISTLSNSPEIDTNSRAKSQKSFQNSLGGISESLERFPGLAQIRHVRKPWAIAQGFCSKTLDFRPSRIFPKSTQTFAQRVRNHFRRIQEAFQRVWSDFQDLPKSAMFKTMGYSPRFLLKTCQISTLSNSPEIDTNSRAKSQKSFQKG